MRHDARAFLYDVLGACDRIELFTTGLAESEFLDNELVRSAVERQFEIIGEAVNQLLKEAPEIARRIPDYRRMIDFRNLLIHAYARVDPLIVWGVVQGSLPALRERIEMLMGELDDSVGG